MTCDKRMIPTLHDRFASGVSCGAQFAQVNRGTSDPARSKAEQLHFVIKSVGSVIAPAIFLAIFRTTDQGYVGENILSSPLCDDSPLTFHMMQCFPSPRGELV